MVTDSPFPLIKFGDALDMLKAPQFAFDVLLKNKSWEQAIDEDWRIDKKWKPGWTYIVRD